MKKFYNIDVAKVNILLWPDREKAYVLLPPGNDPFNIANKIGNQNWVLLANSKYIFFHHNKRLYDWHYVDVSSRIETFCHSGKLLKMEGKQLKMGLKSFWI